MQYNQTVGCADIHIDTKRIDENLKRAQDLLDGRVLNDMKEYIPMDQQKALRNATHIVQPGLIGDRCRVTLVGIPHLDA